MLVKDDSNKFIYSIDVNNSIEYFCESAPSVSDRLKTAISCNKTLAAFLLFTRS
jgi:hypothetical protein